LGIRGNDWWIPDSYKEGEKGESEVKDKFDEYRKALAKFGLGPKYVPPKPSYRICPKCKCEKAIIKEVHPDCDAGMNEIVGQCPVCHYEGDPSEFVKLSKEQSE